MPLTDLAKSGLCLLLSGSVTDRPAYCAIGKGSGTALSSNTFLGSEFKRQTIDTTDASTPRFVDYITTFAAADISGLAFREFGIFSSGATTSGTMWNREGFAAINFDGTAELQVSVEVEVW